MRASRHHSLPQTAVGTRRSATPGILLVIVSVVLIMYAAPPFTLASTGAPSAARDAAAAESGLGAKVYASGGKVIGKILPATADYTSMLTIERPRRVTVGTNREVGKVVDLGSFKKGDELVFALYVYNTGYTYRTGPGSRNPDGIPHAKVKVFGNTVQIGFEDLYGGGDKDYDDHIFQFQGVEIEHEVRGKVRDLDDAGKFRPASGVTVRLAGPVSRTTRTDKAGNYRFTRLRDGDYTVIAPAGYCQSPFRGDPRACSNRVRRTLETQASVVVNFEVESYTLAVEVGDRWDAKRRHADVTVLAFESDRKAFLPEKRTGRDGRADFKRVRAGLYRVTTRVPTWPNGPLPRNARVCLNDGPTPERCETTRSFLLRGNRLLKATVMTAGELSVTVKPGATATRSGKSAFDDTTGFMRLPSRECVSGCAVFEVTVDVVHGKKTGLAPVYLRVQVDPPGGMRTVTGEGGKSVCIRARGEVTNECGRRLLVEVPLDTFTIEYWSPGLVPATKPGGRTPARITIDVYNWDYLPDTTSAQVDVRANLAFTARRPLGSALHGLVDGLRVALSATSKAQLPKDFCDSLGKVYGTPGIGDILKNLSPRWIKKMVEVCEKGGNIQQVVDFGIKTVGIALMDHLDVPAGGLGRLKLVLSPPFFEPAGDFNEFINDAAIKLAELATTLRLSPGSVIYIEFFEVSHPRFPIKRGGPLPMNYNARNALFVRFGVIRAGKAHLVHEALIQDAYLPGEWLPSVRN